MERLETDGFHVEPFGKKLERDRFEMRMRRGAPLPPFRAEPIMKMHKHVLKTMRRAQVAQADAIRARPEFKKVSDEFDIEYEVAIQMQRIREKAGLTQAEIARRMKTTQSVVSRMESGANASLDTLLRYANACGRRLQVKFV